MWVGSADHSPRQTLPPHPINVFHAISDQRLLYTSSPADHHPINCCSATTCAPAHTLFRAKTPINIATDIDCWAVKAILLFVFSQSPSTINTFSTATDHSISCKHISWFCVGFWLCLLFWGVMLDRSQSLFYFVPQEISQTSWLV